GEARDASTPPLDEALRVAVLVNRAEVLESEDERRRIVGDPTEAALLIMGRAAGVDREQVRERMPETRSVPFSSERQWMATIHGADGGEIAYVKGAPGTLVRHATRELADSEERDLDDEGRERWLECNRRLASDGLRVLALARADEADVQEDALER